MMSLWEYRGLVASLVARNVKVKYQRSLLGFLWTLLNPLIMAGVLIGVFTHVIRIQIEHFWAFLISGFFAWNYVSACLYAAAYTLAEHSQITRSIAFPKEVLIVSSGLSKLVEFAAEILLVLILLAVFLHGRVPESFVLVPALIALQFLLTLSLQLPIATLAVFYKDVQHALPLALMALFYLSPVFYPVEMIPAAAQPYYMINPIAQLLTLYHEVLFLGQFPPLDLWLSATASAGILLVVGTFVFSRFKGLFPEFV